MKKYQGHSLALVGTRGQWVDLLNALFSNYLAPLATDDSLMGIFLDLLFLRDMPEDRAGIDERETHFCSSHAHEAMRSYENKFISILIKLSEPRDLLTGHTEWRPDLLDENASESREVYCYFQGMGGQCSDALPGYLIQKTQEEKVNQLQSLYSNFSK
jgi:hypothetical protein